MCLEKHSSFSIHTIPFAAIRMSPYRILRMPKDITLTIQLQGFQLKAHKLLKIYGGHVCYTWFPLHQKGMCCWQSFVRVQTNLPDRLSEERPDHNEEDKAMMGSQWVIGIMNISCDTTRIDDMTCFRISCIKLHTTYYILDITCLLLVVSHWHPASQKTGHWGDLLAVSF